MRIEGLTVDGKQVLSGVFTLVSTHGIPLEMVLTFLKEHNQVPDWLDYIRAALADGHKASTINARILAAVGDVYGPVYAKQINKRLHIIFNRS